MTVAATPHSSATANAQRWMKEKDDLEAKLSDLEKYLTTQRNVGMTGPLIDPNGFPRSDIDVLNVRTARVQVIELRNDLKAVMGNIETALHAVHAQAKAARDSNQAENDPSQNSDSPHPFAVINAVAPDSPAKEAVRVFPQLVTFHGQSNGKETFLDSFPLLHIKGLLKGDLIIRFGSVHAGNHEKLQSLNELVGRSEEKNIDVTVKRAHTRMTVGVIPRRGWGGRGLLGCHIVPV